MSREIYISDSFPSPLYRAFKRKDLQYAYDFLERGSFRLRDLKDYRDMEDSNRRDEDEGEGRAEIIMERPVLHIDKDTVKPLYSTSELGPVHFGTGTINPVYIMCFSGPQVDLDYLAKQYGRYILCINNPNLLVSEIRSNLLQHNNLSDVVWLECIKVRYDKDQLIEELPEPASQERVRMSYGQKNPKFANDCEYRLVLKLPPAKLDAPKEIKIELRKKLEYINIVELKGLEEQSTDV